MRAFLTRPITWPAWKFGVLKLSMISFGVLLGAYFPDFWQNWAVPVSLLFGITVTLATLWGLPLLMNPDRTQALDKTK